MADQDLEGLRRAAAGGDDVAGVRYAFECERRGLAWRSRPAAAISVSLRQSIRVLRCTTRLVHVRRLGRTLSRGRTRGVPAFASMFRDLQLFDDLLRRASAAHACIEWRPELRPWVDPHEEAQAQAMLRDLGLR